MIVFVVYKYGSSIECPRADELVADLRANGVDAWLWIVHDEAIDLVNLARIVRGEQSRASSIVVLPDVSLPRELSFDAPLVAATLNGDADAVDERFGGRTCALDPSDGYAALRSRLATLAPPGTEATQTAGAPTALAAAPPPLPKRTNAPSAATSTLAVSTSEVRPDASAPAGFDDEVEPFEVSVGHPRRLAKGHSAPMFVQVFPASQGQAAEVRLRTKLSGWEIEETRGTLDVEDGSRITVALECPNITFSSAVETRIGRETMAAFLATPDEGCRLGEHAALLRVHRHDTNTDESVPFTLTVVDFAFGHVSRPGLARAVAVVAALGSAASFLMTTLGQVDQVAGLVSGAAGAVAASFVHLRVFAAYAKPTS